MHKYQFTRVEQQLALAEQTNEWLQQGASEREQAEAGQRRALTTKEKALAAKGKALAKALQATRALQKERDLISAILDTVGALVVILNRDGQIIRYYSLPQASEIKSELAVPLKVEDRVIGVLHAQSDRLDDFDDIDLAVLQSLAYQAAIAIENARLYEQAQQELAARKQAETALQKVHDELELRVRERTFELKAANKQLQEEITERKRAEEGQRKALVSASPKACASGSGRDAFSHL